MRPPAPPGWLPWLQQARCLPLRAVPGLPGWLACALCRTARAGVLVHPGPHPAQTHLAHGSAAPVQGSTLLFGAALSFVLTRKLGAQPWKQLAPQLLLIAAFTAELWTLILPN